MVAANLDRRIVVKVTPGERVKGRWEWAKPVVYGVWAMRSDKAAELSVAEGGNREDRMRDYIVRFDGRFILDPERMKMTVTDADGLELTCTGVVEPSGSRRRFLRLETISVAP